MFVRRRIRFPNQRDIPPLNRRLAAVVAHHAKRCRIEQKTASVGSSKSNPSRCKSPEEVTVREESHVAVRSADFADHTIDPGLNLLGTFATGTAVGENGPAWSCKMNLLRR